MAGAKVRAVYTNLMDKLYLVCVGICVVSVTVMTALIFAGVVMRVGFATGARFAEPMAIFFAVQLTMYGAAACYRAHIHLRLQVFVKMLTLRWQQMTELLVQLFMGAIAVLMIVFGISLTQTTWFQSYPEFEYVRVGLVYSAIPGSGIVTLLFVLEALFFRRMELIPDEELQRAVEDTEAQERLLAARGDGRGLV